MNKVGDPGASFSTAGSRTIQSQLPAGSEPHLGALRLGLLGKAPSSVGLGLADMADGVLHMGSLVQTSKSLKKTPMGMAVASTGVCGGGKAFEQPLGVLPAGSEHQAMSAMAVSRGIFDSEGVELGGVG